MPTSTDGRPVAGQQESAPADARGLTAAQRRRVLITAWVMGLIALGFYVGFIILSVIRSHR